MQFTKTEIIVSRLFKSEVILAQNAGTKMLVSNCTIMSVGVLDTGAISITYSEPISHGKPVQNWKAVNEISDIAPFLESFGLTPHGLFIKPVSHVPYRDESLVQSMMESTGLNVDPDDVWYNAITNAAANLIATGHSVVSIFEYEDIAYIAYIGEINPYTGDEITVHKDEKPGENDGPQESLRFHDADDATNSMEILKESNNVVSVRRHEGSLGTRAFTLSTPAFMRSLTKMIFNMDEYDTCSDVSEDDSTYHTMVLHRNATTETGVHMLGSTVVKTSKEPFEEFVKRVSSTADRIYREGYVVYNIQYVDHDDAVITYFVDVRA